MPYHSFMGCCDQDCFLTGGFNLLDSTKILGSLETYDGQVARQPEKTWTWVCRCEKHCWTWGQTQVPFVFYFSLDKTCTSQNIKLLLWRSQRGLSPAATTECLNWGRRVEGQCRKESCFLEEATASSHGPDPPRSGPWRPDETMTDPHTHPSCEPVSLWSSSPKEPDRAAQMHKRTQKTANRNKSSRHFRPYAPWEIISWSLNCLICYYRFHKCEFSIFILICYGAVSFPFFKHYPPLFYPLSCPVTLVLTQAGGEPKLIKMLQTEQCLSHNSTTVYLCYTGMQTVCRTTP